MPFLSKFSPFYSPHLQLLPYRVLSAIVACRSNFISKISFKYLNIALCGSCFWCQRSENHIISIECGKRLLCPPASSAVGREANATQTHWNQLMDVRHMKMFICPCARGIYIRSPNILMQAQVCNNYTFHTPYMQPLGSLHSVTLRIQSNDGQNCSLASFVYRVSSKPTTWHPSKRMPEINGLR